MCNHDIFASEVIYKRDIFAEVMFNCDTFFAEVIGNGRPSNDI